MGMVSLAGIQSLHQVYGQIILCSRCCLLSARESLLSVSDACQIQLVHTVYNMHHVVVQLVPNAASCDYVVFLNRCITYLSCPSHICRDAELDAHRWYSLCLSELHTPAAAQGVYGRVLQVC